MSIIGWMFVGVIAGFIASRVMHKEGRGIIPDILLGIAGALLGGLLFKELAAENVMRLGFYSVVVAVIGAILVLFVYHAVFDRPHAET
jgi:uncharacterized membrane protein YeaQ/YmgE (transglycosylase-associated protein family)